MDTGLIERDLEALQTEAAFTPEHIVFAALILSSVEADSNSNDPFDRKSAFSLWGERSDTFVLQKGADIHEVRLSTSDGIHVNGKTGEFEMKMLQCGIKSDSNVAEIFSSGKESEIPFVQWSGHLALFDQGNCFEFSLPDPLLQAAGAGEGSDTVISPMPGLVKELNVAAGDNVEKGQPMLVLEAMKMEHTLGAPRDGVLKEVNIAQGDQVEDGAILIVLEEEEAAQ